MSENKCICGSGSLYYSCCAGLSPSEIFSKHKKMVISKLMNEATIKTCLFHNPSECRGSIKKAHSIQNNRILTSLAENGEVYMIVPSFDNQVSKLERIGRGKATTFRGFCDKHDTQVFSPIELKEYEPGNLEQESIFAYRAFSKELHAKLTSANLSSNYVDKSEDMKLLHHGTMLALEDMAKDVELFADVLANKKYSQLETKLIIFDSECELSVSSAITLPFDFFGKPLRHFAKGDWDNPAPLFITIFPQSGKTYTLLSYSREYAADYIFLEEQLLSKDLAIQKQLLTRVLVHNVENIVISPRLISRRGEKFSEMLTAEFSKAIKTEVNDSLLDKELPFTFFD